MGYREDVRTPCAACSKAFDDEHLTLDENGRSLCNDCAAREGTAKANQTIAIERGKKMTRMGIAIAVAIAVGGLLTWRSLAKREDVRQRAAIADAEGKAFERIRQLSGRVGTYASEHKARETDKICDDAQLKALARPRGQDFLTYAPAAYENFRSPASRDASDLIRAGGFRWYYYQDLGQLRRTIEDWDASGVIVVYVEQKEPDDGDGEISRYDGTIAVFDIGKPTPPRCWARLRGSYAPGREEYKAALAKITAVLDLAPDP